MSEQRRAVAAFGEFNWDKTPAGDALRQYLADLVKEHGRENMAVIMQKMADKLPESYAFYQFLNNEIDILGLDPMIRWSSGMANKLARLHAEGTSITDLTTQMFRTEVIRKIREFQDENMFSYVPAKPTTS